MSDTPDTSQVPAEVRAQIIREEQEAHQGPPTVECAICGFNGYPGGTCPSCNRPLDQKRQYTLSELRAMPQEQREKIMREDRPSGAAPRIVHIPGSV
jgi:hypothetical protein